MSNRMLSGKALVVQITSEEIRVARAVLGGTAMQLQDQTVLPTPAGAVESGELLEPEALREVLAPVLKQRPFRRCRKVVFVLCSTQVISESVTVPAVKKRQRLGQMLEANMDMYFPVNPAEYRLTWQLAGREQGDGGQLRVQLWAVPRALLGRYYALANSMGLTAAVDFCGHSIASAAGAGFGAPSGKRGKAAGTETDGGTCLYINAERELLLLTFVQNGRVKLQRLLQRGYSQQDDLNEVAMVLDYFAAMPGQTGLTKALLSGGQADETGLRRGLAELLNVSVGLMPCEFGPEWMLCQGASRTDLDFGDPEMNHLTGAARPINRAWQYGLIFLGGAALTASVMLLLTSTMTWDTQLNGLRNTQNQMMLMAQQNAGSGQNYQTYSALYDAYSADWDKVFDSVRTYNDNLELVLAALEEQLPTDATVKGLSVAEQGMAVQAAFQNKEDAAYFLLALRDEPYMTIKAISNLTIGPSETYAPDKMIAMLYEQAGEESPVPETGAVSTDTANDAAEQETEAPPTEGSYSLDGLFSNLAGGNASIDGAALKSMLPLLEMAGADAATIQKLEGYADMMERFGVTVSPGDLSFLSGLAGGSTGGIGDIGSIIGSGNPGSNGSVIGSGSSGSTGTAGGSGSSNSTGKSGSSSSGGTAVEDARTAALRLNLQYLTGAQLDALQKTYGPEQEKTFDLNTLLKSATKNRRKKAIRSLLESDPSAMYKFFLLMREDIEREEDDQILYGLIFDDIWENADMHRMFYESDQAMLDKYMPELLDVLMAKTQKWQAAEKLIRQDEMLSSKLALHLAAAMGRINTVNTALDLPALRKDIDSGAAFTRDATTVDAVRALVRRDEQASVTDDDSGLSISDLLWLLQYMNQNQTGGSGISNIFNTGSSQVQVVEDDRYYLTVVLGYDESLIQAEQIRKGLDCGAKVEKVEVDQ
ncbi:MAG: pilus assembly protein PilM [Oscillospiraceae bacterium]|nr:pilus assembly protein PilM [Oscillospiraceae bacterium]